MAASHYRSTLDIPYTRHIPWKDIFPQEKKILKDQTKVLAIMQKELTSIGKMLQRENQKPICTSQFAEWPAPWKPSLAERNIFFSFFFWNQARSSLLAIAYQGKKFRTVNPVYRKIYRYRWCPRNEFRCDFAFTDFKFEKFKKVI